MHGISLSSQVSVGQDTVEALPANASPWNFKGVVVSMPRVSQCRINAGGITIWQHYVFNRSLWDYFLRSISILPGKNSSKTSRTVSPAPKP